MHYITERFKDAIRTDDEGRPEQPGQAIARDKDKNPGNYREEKAGIQII